MPHLSFYWLSQPEVNSVYNSDCEKCPRKRCITCKALVKSKTFTSNKTKRTYKIRYKLDCRSTWIIYLISCIHPQCGKQYVGKTRMPLCKRHYGHRNQFKNKIGELGKHFHSDHHGEKNASIEMKGEAARVK